MLLTDKYADKIYGTITCYDRMIIQGYIPGWSHAEGMTGYLNANNIRIFDFSNFSQPLTEQIRANARRIADENGIEIEFIRKLRAFRKDDRIQQIIQETGKTKGLIHIFSAMEQCNTYKPWHDKTTGKTFLKFDQSKCLHYYFYFIDKELGLCYLRVPTWAPFRLQFYMNGHNLLAHKLQKKGITYRMHDNAFLEISDVEAAQKLSDRINPEDLHKVLDAFAKRYCPVPETLGLSYMGDVSIKMYDKFGHVLRIESTCNDIGTFRVKRKVEHRDGSSSEQKAPLKKSMYSLYHQHWHRYFSYAEILPFCVKNH